MRKDFSNVQATDVNYFKSILGANRVLTEDTDVMPFNIDWIKNCRGKSIDRFVGKKSKR